MNHLDELVARSKQWLRIMQADLHNSEIKNRTNLSELPGSTDGVGGSFNNFVLKDNSTDFASQMFWHIAKENLLADGNASQSVTAVQGLINSTDNSPTTNWYTNCQGSGAKCPSHYQPNVQAKEICDCGFGQENLAYTRICVAQLENFLAGLLTSLESDESEPNRKVYEAVSANNEIAKTGLKYLNDFLAEHQTEDSKFVPLATAASYYATLLVQSNLAVLQMAWHKTTHRQAINLNVSESNVGNKISKFLIKASQYVIPDKKFIQTHPKIKDTIEEVFKVHGISATFSKWPVLYICVIWLSKIFNEENGGDSTIRFISGLADSLVMSDWFNTGAGNNDSDDGSTNQFWIFLGIVFKAAKETFDMRMRLFGDAAAAFRGVIQGVHFETKNKIEFAFDSADKHMVEALVKSKLDKLPSFRSWMTMCIYDIGLSGILGNDSVNSLTRIREASLTFLLFNDIVDFKRDWTCGEIRNFLIIQYTHTRQLLSSATRSFNLLNETIAVSVGAFEFILRNEAIYGSANVMAQHCVYPWQVASGRYGMIKTYLLNIGNYLQEQEEHERESDDYDEGFPDILKWKPSIRVVDEHIKAFTHRFDDNFQPILNANEVVELRAMSVDQLLAKCYLYMGVDSKIESISPVVGNITSRLSTRLENELVRCELPHDECKNHLSSSLLTLLSQEDAATVIGIITSISHLTAYVTQLLDGKSSPVLDYRKLLVTSERMIGICEEIYLKFALIMDICTVAHIRGTPVCASCCEQLGNWIDETCCETAIKFEQVVENFPYIERMKLLKIIMGSCNFAVNYMKVPFYELHLRSNLMAIVSQQRNDEVKMDDSEEKNSGDKFTF